MDTHDSNLHQLNNTHLLLDLYSANEHGVLGAIKHLNHYKGQKVFVGMPLKELGDTSETVHRRIFTALKKQKTKVFWIGTDYEAIGKEILGNLWQGGDLETLKSQVAIFGDNDAILLESRLPQSVGDLFSVNSPQLQ